ncbi:hypothetical protein OAE97_03040, partial [Verrucomicrobia bacterium]|nr:hypothetical protein [Verrucomicrobiota bacterium]
MTSAAIKPLHDHKTGRGDFVICLGAGKSQLPLIVAAKKCGYKVVAVDQNPIAPGFQISDIVICQSTYKVDPIIKDLHAHPLLASSEQCRGILNRSSGWPVVTAASLCTRLNLPGIPERSAMAIVNKHLLRKHCSEEGLPSPKYEIYGTRELSKPCHLEFPLVVKPSLSLVGKSGVSVVDNKIALNDAMERAVRYTTNGTILVEEFLPGKDFCLVGFVQNTRVVPICLLEELNETGGDGKIYGKGFKTRGMSMDGPLVLDACSIAQKISDIFKIRRSPFMVSLRMDSYGKLNL